MRSRTTDAAIGRGASSASSTIAGLAAVRVLGGGAAARAAARAGSRTGPVVAGGSGNTDAEGGVVKGEGSGAASAEEEAEAEA